MGISQTFYKMWIFFKTGITINSMRGSGLPAAEGKEEP